MKPVLTPDEAVAADRAAAARGVAPEELMENAGAALAGAVMTVTGGAYGRRAVVVCGKGNNGGDGFVAARRLHAAGMRVAVVCPQGPPDREPSASACSRLPGVRLRGVDDLRSELGRADVAVDALFGTGFRGTAAGDSARAIDELNASGVPVVSADIPSGVSGETGAVDGPAVRATITVAFGFLKRGNVLFPGRACCGELRVADIGFPPDVVAPAVGLVEPDDVARLWPARSADTHKRAVGAVLIVGGSRAMTGAVVLAASAAYRAGAGLVTVATVAGALPVVAGSVAEATYLELPETSAGTMAAGAGEILLERLPTYDACAVGPGLGRNDETDAFVRDFVRQVSRPTVVDADSLNAFAGRAQELASGGDRLVLTPHVGEFARLVHSDVGSVTRDRIRSVCGLAATTGTTVLLKGSHTVIGKADGSPVPDGTSGGLAPVSIRINPTGGPFLATAGTGDVLTGTIAALLAGGLAPFDAAAAAAYVHGRAGALAAERRGDGTSARDVCEMIPQAVREVSR